MARTVRATLRVGARVPIDTCDKRPQGPPSVPKNTTIPRCLPRVNIHSTTGGDALEAEQDSVHIRRGLLPPFHTHLT
jgi:hypothetical protein